MVFYIHTNILIIMLHYVFKNSENIYIYIYTYRCIIQRVITNPYKHGAHDETLCLFAKWSV
jgi:hypothetical protein